MVHDIATWMVDRIDPDGSTALITPLAHNVVWLSD